MADRDVIRRKIAALRKMTRSAGCSEAEAMAAAEKAAELMREHGLSTEAVGADDKGIRARSAGMSVRDRLWGTVARCTNTCSILDTAAREWRFVGDAPGPEIAVYLYTVLNRAIDAAIDAFKATRNYKRRKPASRRAAVHDFTLGMILRLAVRLREIFDPVVSDEARNRALAARASLYPSTSAIAVRARNKRLNPSAYWDGVSAGQTVPLSHGVGGNSVPFAAIGRAI